MKLDAHMLRYLSRDEFRILTAVEMGMKNHQVVPAQLVESIAGLRNGGAYKNMSTLLKHKLVAHDRSKYDGFKLTYGGYDYLALRVFSQRGHVVGVGRQIGVGKESDVYEVLGENDEALCLKLHRLGRISFRAIKSKRDYLLHRKSASWLYLARLAALKEFAYLKALYDNGFPVPRPVDVNRHCVLMGMVYGYPLSQISELGHPGKVYAECMELIMRFASYGLIHCDFNEFNLMVDDDENVTTIDFPQMVSTSHRNAKEYFQRDVECIRVFFERRFRFESEEYPTWEQVVKKYDLDIDIAASGFDKKMGEHLDAAMDEMNLRGDEDGDDDDDDDDDIDDDGDVDVGAGDDDETDDDDGDGGDDDGAGVSKGIVALPERDADPLALDEVQGPSLSDLLVDAKLDGAADDDSMGAPVGSADDHQGDHAEGAEDDDGDGDDDDDDEEEDEEDEEEDRKYVPPTVTDVKKRRRRVKRVDYINDTHALSQQVKRSAKKREVTRIQRNTQKGRERRANRNMAKYPDD